MLLSTKVSEIGNAVEPCYSVMKTYQVESSTIRS